MDKVIVVGCSVPGYGVIRALADKNIRLIGLTYARKDTAQLSRYLSEVVHIPVPEENEEQFVEHLIKNADRWEGALILETSDNVSIVLSKNKERLSKHYKMVTPDWPIHRLFVEKENTYALAKECGVPFPGSKLLARREDRMDKPDFPFPCILKPVRSFEFITKFHVKNFEIKNEKELDEKLDLCLNARIPVLLQEVIPGPDENLFKLQGYINSQGRMVGKFFHRKLRQHPPHFGVMRVGVSTDAYPEVEQLAERLLRHANYRGYFSIEFKKDPRNGQLKLMENNCRLVRCSLLATASGINHPWIIYQDLVKGQQVDITEYRKGLYWIELFSDLSDSIFLHRQEDIRLWDYIKPYFAAHKVFSDLDMRDTKPFLQFVKQKFINKFQGSL